MHCIRNAFAHMDRSDGKAAPRIGSRTAGGGQPPIGVYPSKAEDRTTTSISMLALPVLSTGTACCDGPGGSDR